MGNLIPDPETIGGYNVQKYPWFSPHLVITTYGRLAKLYGSNIESKREFKSAKEMFDAAIALLGAYELHPDNKYLLQLNLQSDSPDVVAVKQAEIPNSSIRLEITQLEIVSMNDFSSTDDVVEFLRKTKLSPKKSYSNKMMIVCVVNKKIQIDRLKITKGLKKIKPKPTIYILGKLQDNNQWAIFSPYPKPTKFVIYSLSGTMKKYQLPSCVTLHRGTAKKISYTQSCPLVTTIWDLFNIKKSDVEKYKINV